VDENGEIQVTLGGSDPDGDSLAFSIAREPEHGLLSGTSPHLTYTPASGYAGTDSFDFVAHDGSTYSSPVTVNISVLAVNNPPSAANVEAETEEDETVIVYLSAIDSDSDDVIFDIESTPSHGSLGSVEKTGPLTAAVTYRPQHNYHGTDSFTFSVGDGEFESETATATIDIEWVNDAPEVAGQSIAAEAGEPVEITLRGEDIDDDSLDFLIVQGAGRGTLGSVSSDGDSATVAYTPDPDESGQDSFTFRATDGDLESDTATVTIAISAAVPPPASQAPVQQAPASQTPVPQPPTTPQAPTPDTTQESPVSSDPPAIEGSDASEGVPPQTPAERSPAATEESSVEVPPPELVPDDVMQGAALQSLSTASVQGNTFASSPAAWLIPVALVSIASVVAILGHQKKGSRVFLVALEKLFGLMTRAGLIQPETAGRYLGHFAGQPFSDQMSRIYKLLNDERYRAARKQIFDVLYDGARADPREYEISKSVAKKQLEQIGSILRSKPELQEPYFDSFGEVTLKVWWAIKEEVDVDARKGMRWESLEWLGAETEKYWAKHSSNAKTS
jgi:hypothetical protein